MSHATSMSQNAQNEALPIIESELSQGAPVCCSPVRLMRFGFAIVTVISIGTAAFFAGRNSTLESQAALNLPLINATASATSEKYSMATGLVSDDAEGLFMLDHNSGQLQCTVIYPRRGRFLALFSTNVAETLGAGGKGGSYIMVTGRADFPRASNRPAGACAVYVMDTATGNYAAYGIPFERAAVNAGRPQQGALILIGTGSANPVIDRDSLR